MEMKSCNSVSLARTRHLRVKFVVATSNDTRTFERDTPLDVHQQQDLHSVGENTRPFHCIIPEKQIYILFAPFGMLESIDMSASERKCAYTNRNCVVKFHKEFIELVVIHRIGCILTE